MTAARGRRLRGGRAADEPRPRRPRPGRARVVDADQPRSPGRATATVVAASRRSCGRRTSSGSGSSRRTSRPPTTPLAAIADAEIVVLGPGSLFTSVLPVLLIPRHPGMPSRRRRASASTSATSRRRSARPRASTSPTTSRRCSRTPSPDLVDLVVANDRFDGDGGTPGRPTRSSRAGRPRSTRSPRLVTDAVASLADPHHHDPERLAAAILRAVEREGPAIRREREARSAAGDRAGRATCRDGGAG